MVPMFTINKKPSTSIICDKIDKAENLLGQSIRKSNIGLEPKLKTHSSKRNIQMAFTRVLLPSLGGLVANKRMAQLALPCIKTSNAFFNTNKCLLLNNVRD